MKSRKITNDHSHHDVERVKFGRASLFYFIVQLFDYEKVRKMQVELVLTIENTRDDS